MQFSRNNESASNRWPRCCLQSIAPIIIAAFSTMFAFPAATYGQVAPDRRLPNIVLIVADDK